MAIQAQPGDLVKMVTPPPRRTDKHNTCCNMKQPPPPPDTYPVSLGMSGFHLRGGGRGVNRAPKNWGVGQKAQLTGTINQLL